jgi:hypothetical protein
MIDNLLPIGLIVLFIAFWGRCHYIMLIFCKALEITSYRAEKDIDNDNHDFIKHYDLLNKKSYVLSVFDLRKWKFNQFYPELISDLDKIKDE